MQNTPYQWLFDQLVFNEDGLIPVVTQQYDTGELLMQAWMNREAIEQTLQTQKMVYWSRSRQKLWKKGETSDQVQALKELIADCDYDCLLAKVDQTGVACHTGRRSCFYLKVGDQEFESNQEPLVSPDDLYSS